MKIGNLGGKTDKIIERQLENRHFHLIFGIFELKKIRELVNRELDNPRISAPWLYNNHPQGIVDEPVFDWKVSEKAQIDPKNALELHILTQNISGKIAKAKLKQVMATIREE